MPSTIRLEGAVPTGCSARQPLQVCQQTFTGRRTYHYILYFSRVTASNAYIKESNKKWGKILHRLFRVGTDDILTPTDVGKTGFQCDRVLDGRLPEHSDITSLPYLPAVVKEVYRYALGLIQGLARCIDLNL